MRLLNGGRRHLAFGLAVLTVFFVGGCAGLHTKPPSDVNFTGEWQLNSALSEDPSTMARGAGPGQPGGGMGRPGGPGGGGMGGMGGRGPGGVGGGFGGHGGRGGGGMPGRPGAMRDLLDQPEKLSIAQAPTELNLVADGVSTKLVYGEKVTDSASKAEREAGWKGNDFVVKRSMKDGPSSTRSYSLTDEGRQLVVTTKISGGRGPGREFVSIYERRKE